MKYYKVKKYIDDLYRYNNGYYFKDDFCIIQNELFTEKELEKLRKKYLLKNSYFDIINISKNKTYFFFGARFADDSTIKKMQEKEKIIDEYNKQQAKFTFYND